MAEITWNPAAVSGMASTITSFAAKVGEVKTAYAQQRARLDPEFTGAGAETYYEKQMLSEQGLKQMEEGLQQLAQIVTNSLHGTQQVDQMSRGFFG